MSTPGLPALETTEEETPRQGFLANAPKGKGLTPAGQLAMDPKQTAELLANMEQMVNERTGAFNTFLGGLKDASAWGSGGIEGPSRALAAREEAKAKEFNDVYNMRTQMASYRAAQAQQDAYNEEQKRLFPGVGGNGAAGGAGTMYKGVMLDPEIAVGMSQARSREERDKIFNDFASKRAQARGGFTYNPASYAENITRVDEYGRPVNINALQAQQGYTPGGQPQTAPRIYGSDVIPAIKQGIFGQESLGGKMDTSTPNYAGAIGPMQIKQGTFDDLKKEGLIPENYDITNPKHNKIAGDTLIDKYAKQYKNDPDKIAAAYYGGPGAINKDGSINYDWRDTKNPKAPTVGEYIQQVKQKAGLTSASADMVRPGLRPTPIEALSTQKVQETQDIAAATKSGQYLGGKEATVIEAGETAGNRLAAMKNIEGLVDNPATNRVFGVFEKPGFWNGFGAIVQSGIKVGSLGEVGLKDLDKLVTSNMQGASQQEKDAAQIATREFAKMQLEEAKILLAGQGAVSDAERGLIAQLTGSRLNSPGAIKEYLTWNKMRAQYDGKVGELYAEFKTANPRATFDQFRVSPEARAARREYNAQMMAFAAEKGIDMKRASAEGAELNAGKQPSASKQQWKYSDSDYQSWKKSRGLQ